MASVDSTGVTFPTLVNDCILKAARGQRTEFVPVWVMRQAGRYLPEFRELRTRHSFFELCEQPELACEVTLMPVKRFNLDAAIIFSDILVIPQALGMTVEMLAGHGPHFPEPLKQGEPIDTKLTCDIDVAKRLDYVYKAITLTRHKLKGKCPLIGFSGAPWTLMCYMVGAGGTKTMAIAKKWLYQDSENSARLLEVVANKVADHLVEQAKAGAQLLQIFESHAEHLTVDLFERFAYPQIVRICRQVKDRLKTLGLSVPLIVFAKGGHHVMDLLARHNDVMDVLSLDWTMDPSKIRQLSSTMCLQGNLDPCALYATSDELRELTKKMIKSFGTQNYIANLGHGIYPDKRPESVESFVGFVHEISRELNNKGL